MPRIYMIRHGKAAAGWDADADPGLDDLGRTQAEAAADEIEKRIDAPLPVLSSPLRRCRETAEPLSGRWGLQPQIEPRVAEVPSPVEDLRARGEWLRSIMAGTWADAVAAGDGKHTAYDSKLLAWRQSVVDALLELESDTVIFSHFIAINVALGHAVEDPRVICFKPDNCSVTVFETAGGTLSLVEQGREADTKVN
ncbi:phosphoglycerate mutase [Tepidicaulis marinus]|uniref:Phosphoglycerate mutase n=1 Tax=Tepidicaulis marinus TaxID=1333998 RepID=A0A081B968_9HYPH|nr:histidine phosphatase family protein [Tepidicaulis marinus]GAK44586.1 phosphoglycerate mutase [Tepidicaulis marinus]